MARALKIVIFTLVLGFTLGINQPAMSQCAQCAATVETNSQSGDKAAAGINNGIMFLLATPYLAVAIVGVIWYKKYRRKNIPINIRDEKLNLN